MPPKFGHQYEKFCQARSGLMLPHPRDEAHSMASAFEVISRCLRDLDRSKLDDNATTWLLTIERTMDTTGVVPVNPDDGTWLTKARTLSYEQKHDFAKAVDELAYWFGRHND